MSDIRLPRPKLPTLIDSDPERMAGEVCFAGTRTPVRSLFDYLAAGQPLDEFLEDFPGARKDRTIAVLHEAFSILDELAKEAAAMTKKWDQIKRSGNAAMERGYDTALTTATWLSELRQRCGLTQADMAQRLGKSHEAISQLEAETNTHISSLDYSRDCSIGSSSLWSSCSNDSP